MSRADCITSDACLCSGRSRCCRSCRRRSLRRPVRFGASGTANHETVAPIAKALDITDTLVRIRHHQIRAIIGIEDRGRTVVIVTGSIVNGTIALIAHDVAVLCSSVTMTNDATFAIIIIILTWNIGFWRFNRNSTFLIVIILAHALAHQCTVFDAAIGAEVALEITDTLGRFDWDALVQLAREKIGALLLAELIRLETAVTLAHAIIAAGI